MDKPCHHFLYSGGAFAQLYPINPTPTRHHAAKTKKQLRVRYKFALDIWGLMSVPYSRLRSPRMVNKVMARLCNGTIGREQPLHVAYRLAPQ